MSGWLGKATKANFQFLLPIISHQKVKMTLSPQTEFPLEESDPSLITPPHALEEDVYKLRLIREVSDETAETTGATADVSTIYIPAESRRALISCV